MPPEPTVFVVDDDEAVRDSMKWLVESVGLRVEIFESAQAFLAGYDPGRPGCLVLDVRMPGMSGLELQERLAEEDIGIPVIVMTGFGDVPTAVRAMKTGAVDFIEKPFNDQAMLDLIHDSLERDAEMRRERSVKAAARAQLEKLTQREREVMRLVVSGMSNKEIARELDIAPKTVEAHRAKVMEKMGVGSLAELVQTAAVSDSSVGDP